MKRKVQGGSVTWSRPDQRQRDLAVEQFMISVALALTGWSTKQGGMRGDCLMKEYAVVLATLSLATFAFAGPGQQDTSARLQEIGRAHV